MFSLFRYTIVFLSKMQAQLTLFLLVSRQLLTNSQRIPTISYISQEQITDIGSSVDLVCCAQYTQDYPVLWSKRDRNRLTEPALISSGTNRIIPDSRFVVYYDRDKSTYTLSIDGIQETDSGFYRCQVLINPALRITAEVEVRVRAPPLIFDNSTRSLVLVEGQSTKLECYAGGFPTPIVYWRKQNNEPLPTRTAIYRGNVLNIKTVRKEDRGTYYCVADNGVGRGARRNVALEVQFAPIVLPTRKRVGQALLYDMDLECKVEAYPPPAIVWLKDGLPLTNNHYYEISHFTTSDEITYTVIRIKTIRNRQYGFYSCKASNTFGTSEAKIELFETAVAMCPPACGDNQQ